MKCSCQQVSLIVIAQRRVIRAIDLINIQVVVGFCTVNLFDIGPLAVQALPGHFRFLVSQQVLHIHHTNSVMRIQGGELLARTDLQPMCQPVHLAAEQCMQHQHRQREIIDIIILLRDLQLDAVMLMDLRKHGDSVRSNDLFGELQHVPNFRLHEKAVRAAFFICISECIQTDDRSSLLRQEGKIVRYEFPRRLRRHVQVNLLLVKRAPYLLLAAVLKLHLHIRRTRLAFIDQIHILRSRLAARPEILIADEQIGIRRLILLLQKILKIRRLPGNMIDHKIIHHVVLGTDPLNPAPFPKCRINLGIVHRRKSPVTRRRIERQQMYSSDNPLQMPVQYFI
ncbi:hypothetical protein D3C75_649520 [compost metagenome]